MKNYVVIGASTGIGAALSDQLSSEGQQVFASFNSHEQVNRGNINFFAFDVMNDELDVNSLPDEIHGIAYCPGAINLKPFHRIKDEEFIADFQLQSLGAVKVIRALLPMLKKAPHASIVLFSTVAVQKGFSFHAQVSMSKGAIEGLTKALAAEFAPKIRVNAIAPALTDTPLAGKLLSTPEKKEFHADKNPLKRVGEASDLAQTAAFLLSDQSSWINGQIIHVDGGFSTLG